MQHAPAAIRPHARCIVRRELEPLNLELKAPYRIASFAEAPLRMCKNCPFWPQTRITSQKVHIFASPLGEFSWY